MLRYYLKTPTIQKHITISRHNLFFTKKTQKNNHSSASGWCENTKSSFKENNRTFLKNSTTHVNIRISRLKEDCKTYAKKKTTNKQTKKQNKTKQKKKQKLNQWLKTCKVNFIN